MNEAQLQSMKPHWASYPTYDGVGGYLEAYEFWQWRCNFERDKRVKNASQQNTKRKVDQEKSKISGEVPEVSPKKVAKASKTDPVEIKKDSS